MDKKTILIIDDNRIDRMLYVGYLEADPDIKYKILEADCGKTGIQIFKDNSPDCVLLDYQLPEMNGIEILTNLTDEKTLLPVIMLTGTGDEKLAVEAMKLGAQDYLVKGDLNKEDLWRATHNAMEKISLYKQIRETEERLKAILSNAPSMIYMKDLDRKYIMANNTFIKLNGLKSESDIIRKTDFDIFPKQFAGSFAKNDDIVFKSKKVHSFEESFPNGKKENRVFSVQKFPLFDDKGKIYALCSIAQNITAKKKYEEEITAARIAADKANHAKSEFLATMSHEIRTPMNGIIGVADLLGYTGLSEKQEHYVHTIQSSGELLLVILNDVLDFSKIEAGEMTLESEPFSIKNMLVEVIKLLTNRAIENDVELAIRYPDNITDMVKGDSVRFRQIVINLVGNAIKFSSGGHILINVEEQKKTKKDISLKFEVVDTGIGIPSNKLDHIFEHFTQADSSTTREFGGTGLGLAICKRIVGLMGGKIGVKSKPGKGSNFWFEVTLPITNDMADSKKKIRPSKELNGKKVLIVDDYDINLQIFKEYLQPFDIEVNTFQLPLEAIEEVKTATKNGRPYDILLVDYYMPEMNGEEFGSIIHGNPEIYGHPKMILITAVGRDDKIDFLDKYGYTAHLLKPIYSKTLVQSMIESLHDKSAKTFMPTGSSRKNKKEFHLNILLVEDFQPNQEVATDMLHMLGCNVDLATNGLEAIEKIKKGNYDIVFMDCQMPQMDGFEATKEIRAKKLGGNIPIIAMTASALEGDRKRCIQAGMNEYITKPVKISDLESTLDDITNNSTNKNKQQNYRLY